MSAGIAAIALAAVAGASGDAIGGQGGAAPVGATAEAGGAPAAEATADAAATRGAVAVLSLKVPALHATGVLVGMRIGVWALWPDTYDPFAWDRIGRQLRRSYTEAPAFRSDRALLESDGDPWPLNLFGHALFGSELWQRSRGCGLGPVGSALLMTGASLAWEYGLEATAKQPSAVDLVLTPVLGAALGEARHRLRVWASRRPSSGWRRGWAILVDPFGEAERALGTRC